MQNNGAISAVPNLLNDKPCNSCMPKINVSVSIPTDYDVKDENSAAVRDIIANMFPYDPRFEQLKKAGCSVFVTVEGQKPKQPEINEPHVIKHDNEQAAKVAAEHEAPAKEATAAPATAQQPENVTS